MEKLVGLLRHLLTGSDNATHDLGRWSWVLSFFTVVGTTAWHLLHGVAVGVQDVANALGAVSLSHGAALWAKRDTEPSKPAAGGEK